METFGAEPDAPFDVCLQKVGECEALVVIVGHRYGWVPSVEKGGDGEKSMTRIEVETAIGLGREVYAFLIEDDQRGPGRREQDDLEDPAVNSDPAKVAKVVKGIQGLQSFRKMLLDVSTVAKFKNPDDLATNVVSALHKWANRKWETDLRLETLQARADQHIRESLESHGYRFDWDVREGNAERELFLDAETASESAEERGLVERRSAVLLKGRSGQGKSWRLYRLGHELVEQGKLAILVSAGGEVKSDIQEITAIVNRQLLVSASGSSLSKIQAILRQRAPNLPEPWLTVLIDGVKDESYALSLLYYPWEEMGLRVALACRSVERSSDQSEARILEVPSFTLRELNRYLRLRLGEAPSFPKYIRDLLTLPLYAKLYCDLGRQGAVWRSPNEYRLFEQVWLSKTKEAPLAASALAALASRLPEDTVYPWPLSLVWAAGLRDKEVHGLVDSGFLRWTDFGRSLEIEDDRVLNWALAEGLVSALRGGEITAETLPSRAIQGQSASALTRRLNYAAMDTLWLMAAPELKLDGAIAQFLNRLSQEWDTDQLRENLFTLGPRITPHLIAGIAATPSPDEVEE